MCVEYMINFLKAGCIQDVIDACGGVCFMENCFSTLYPPRRDECLCSVDMPATQKMFGPFVYENMDEVWP